LGEHQSSHIPIFFRDKNTGEVNKAVMCVFPFLVLWFPFLVLCIFPTKSGVDACYIGHYTCYKRGLRSFKVRAFVA
jgi:hypothetical protein